MKKNLLIAMAAAMGVFTASYAQDDTQVAESDGTVMVSTYSGNAHISAMIIVDNDNYVLTGGHTTNFERYVGYELFSPEKDGYTDGTWIPGELLYTNNDMCHDDGAQVTLLDGRSLLLGGHSSGRGIGYSADAHMYDPATKSFTTVGSMKSLRAVLSALTMTNGKVFIAGNWYKDDNTAEIYDPETGTSVQSITLPAATSNPYLINTKDGGVAILPVANCYGQKIWDGSYYKYSADGEVTTVKAEGMDDYTPQGVMTSYLEQRTMADGSFVFSAKDGQGKSALMKFDAETERFSKLFDINTSVEGIQGEGVIDESTILVNPKSNIAHVAMLEKSNSKYALVSYDLNSGDVVSTLIINKPAPFTAKRLLSDGSIIVLGGSSEGDNYYASPWFYMIKTAQINPTAITSAKVDADSEAIFDLTGRRVAKPVANSIYIKNGRKFVAR